MTAHASRMTEPERRRAAGENAFCDCSQCVSMARWLAIDAGRGDRMTVGQGLRIVELWRALVLQTLLVTFSPPWGES